ncbi:DMT family transporter [Salipiger mangrovisoli]|uniref:DMT family transporter n=1 Tax=Salipiger mangrovisoli TaxID=2865933 RepID=A0ABR9X9M6_9RHOB|nr:DMT family transporter [Salipiger mangrovisoli]MBE9640314.1 DMT family transporter [Salipiger mangrovisoli]
MKRPIDITAVAVMVLLCLVWGLQQSAMKIVAGSIDPMLQIGLRSVCAAGLVLGLSRLLLRDRWHRGMFFGPGLLVGTLFALEFLLVAEGLRWTTASHMAVFLYTAPIFAAIGLHVAQPDERMGVLQWTGVGITFLGVAAIFVLPELHGPGAALTPGVILGDMLGLGAGLCWGLTTVVIRTTRVAEAPPAQTLFYQLLIAGVAALGFCAVTGRLALEPTASVLISLSFQTVIVCSLSFLVWFRMLQIYRSSRLGVLTFMTPVFGVVSGALLLGETLSFEFLLGCALVLSGMIIVQAQEWVSARRAARSRLCEQA